MTVLLEYLTILLEYLDLASTSVGKWSGMATVSTTHMNTSEYHG